MSGIFSELRRRNVFRVAIAYAVVGWLVAQIADVALASFSAPDWVMKTLLLLLIIGLPVAIILAWAFELTPDGVRRESEVVADKSIARQTGRKLDFIIIGFLAIALIYFVYESRVENSATAPASIEKSIAVIPFINIGGRPEDGYLSDGLAETLLHMLAQIEELQVAARTSAFKFKDTNEDIRIIGEQLGVATILEGSIQRSGNKIRITAQLINVDDGFHLWSGNFDRSIDDIFAVQDEIATAVVAALQVTLLGGVQGAGSRDPAAYDALLRLRDEARSGSTERLVAAIAKLEALVDRYPENADVFAALATAQVTYAKQAGLIPEEIGLRALQAARKAVALGSDLASAQIALAHVYVEQGDFISAAPVLVRAMELEPGNADLLVDQASVLAARGEFSEAMQLLERALKLDPLNFDTRVAVSNLYVATGKPDKAKSVLQSALDLTPDNQSLLQGFGSTNVLLGDYEEAVANYLQVVALEPKFINAWQQLFYLYVDFGDLETAEKYLLEIEALSQNRAADERALFCFLIDDKDCQYQATQRMIDTRDAFFVHIWHARMLLDDQQLAEAVAVMQPVAEYFDATGATYGSYSSRITLGALYNLASDLEKRDEVLNAVTDDIEFGVRNGWASWEPEYYLASVAAARGEIAAAIPHLDRAREQGFRGSFLFGIDPVWDAYHSDSMYQAAVARIAASNAEVLALIQAK